MTEWQKPGNTACRGARPKAWKSLQETGAEMKVHPRLKEIAELYLSAHDARSGVDYV
jgi:hypothetical protein